MGKLSVLVCTLLVSTSFFTWSGEIKTYEEQVLYPIVDTGQVDFFTASKLVDALGPSSEFYGQDANYLSRQAVYVDHGDGTISDRVTGLMWQAQMTEKMTYKEALSYAQNSELGAYTDWRLPTIKELFSLILYTGSSGGQVAKEVYIDTTYFNQALGDTNKGEREIDAQTWSATKYVAQTMNGDETIFGVNFIDGRIKGYPLYHPKTGQENKAYFRLVRGNTSYGKNIFIDNQDGTVSDLATGLMWQKSDDGQVRNWKEALKYCQELTLAGYSDWRLPSIKELQSIVDYTKSPATTSSPAINNYFTLSEIIDPNGEKNYGYYWSSTTHQDGINPASSALYVAFGEAQGMMQGKVLDVHGAGSVRSDPKSSTYFSQPSYFGPQGDLRYTYNFLLAVRDIQED